MSEVYNKLFACANAVKKCTDFVPNIALVLGSGLGAFADEIDTVASVEYSDIPGFPQSTVLGHRGRFVFGYVKSVPVVIMQGRVHCYEGYPIEDVVLPVRLMGMLGAKKLILTNAAGCINPRFDVGDLMLITDHILYGVPSPLIGPNIGELGTRFPDMSEVYSEKLRDRVKKAAAGLGQTLREGVYIQTSGPNFETPAEIRAYRSLGADVVGMSTACEAVAARHMGLLICGISCVSNFAAGMSSAPLTHEEVQEAADSAAPRFKTLLTEAIAVI
ncbi:MAG: purine-nucleoside phosphorylase [Clostridiales bacterium]|nr:purine-nucleoside phosphorylase [Clostridiales bacterium]